MTGFGGDAKGERVGASIPTPSPLRCFGLRCLRLSNLPAGAVIVLFLIDPGRPFPLPLSLLAVAVLLWLVGYLSLKTAGSSKPGGGELNPGQLQCKRSANHVIDMRCRAGTRPAPG